jgi:hypothetical protein
MHALYAGKEGEKRLGEKNGEKEKRGREKMRERKRQKKKINRSRLSQHLCRPYITLWQTTR